MRWTIRNQLLIPILVLLLGVAGIGAWTAIASVQRARRQIEENLRDKVGQSLQRPVTFPRNAATLEYLKGLTPAEYLLVDPEMGQIGTFEQTGVELPAPETVVNDWQDLRLGSRVEVAGRYYLGSGIRLKPAAGAPERGVLYIFYPEALWRDAFWEAIRPSLVLGAFLGLASIVLTVGVAHRLGKRIQEIERRTRLIAAGDFSPMPLPGRNDELRDLGQSINEMAQRLALLQDAVQRNERLRLLGQVGGGLAHQLRNGVAGAKLAVQLHARECNGHTDPETLDVALRELTLVEANLKRFLNLGRTGPLQRENCDLAALMEQIISLLRPRCRHTHIDLRWERPATPVVIAGDASQLEQLFLNVIGNAIEAAGVDGWVEVRMKPGDKQCAIEIVDSGPGPPAELADRLFEPFVTGKCEGVGLGLAVAKEVVVAHGGIMDWTRENDRTRFMIALPSFSPEPHETNPDRR